MGSRDKVASAFTDYANEHKNPNKLTNAAGAPIDTVSCSLSIGKKGPILLQDVTFLEHMGRFDRERIPERVVHAKGAGAFGYFETTHDVTKYTKLKPFEKIGKKTRVSVRFSTVGGERGSADTARDPRGFAIKFYTEDGNWDLVGNNTPIFFIRDPILFPSFIHTQKRNPRTHCKDPDMFWDFISLRPETCHQVSFLFSDRGVPDGYRHMNGYGSHTFKLINAKNEPVYCKFHFKTDQGIKCIYQDRADVLAGTDPDYALRDLFNAIANGTPPSWTLYLQIMTFEQAEKVSYDPFDLTKIWPHSEFPLIQVGKLVLNENPQNYFADVEQSAYCPADMIPGVEPSPDRMLLGRLFSYRDTHFHRLGTNYLQFPVNRPTCQVGNYQVDGPQTIIHQGGAPNYYPNSFSGPPGDANHKVTSFKVSGDVIRYDSHDEDNFTQAGNFYRKVLKEDEKDRLTSNIAGHLKNAAEFIQKRTVEMFSKVDSDYGNRIRQKLDKLKK